MGGRFWMSMVVMVVALTSVLMTSCTSPGTPFSYLDLKTTFGASASPAQPVVGQATTINFTVRNTWNQPLNAVAWELRENSDPLLPTSGTVIASGTADIPAFGSSAQSVLVGGLTKGTHTYAVIVDPLNAVAEQDETNNTSQVSVLVADQDILFGTPAPTITGPGGAALTSADTTTPLTLTFTVLDTVNAAQTAPGAVNVPYTIMLNGVDIAPAPATVTIDPTAVTPPVTQVVTVTLPATQSAGSFVYVITLAPAAGDDSVTTNNTATVIVTIPAPG